MKRLIPLIALALFSTAAFADGPVRRTVVIRDGKVISNGDVLELSSDLLGGKRAYLGVSLIDVTEELREHYGAPKNAGVLVGGVEDGSPAAKAGFRVGDIVLAVDGKDIDSSRDLRLALREKKEGDAVRVDILRGHSRQTLVANVAEREGLRILRTDDLEGIATQFNSPEWRARVARLGDCGDLQTRIKELETRLKDLEKKLQK